ncbi:hypothetical protein BD410DRAFT_826324 [Rickenella mellea]|uniref:MICOS complex subunit MIC60 n=1 Tax=Rickenella mellea TaxID=50990 RepID=A0A4Y7QE69_9AGAM|nr:hypothetical protein BD410DRAFT_826324 [Rickenella mellea]
MYRALPVSRRVVHPANNLATCGRVLALRRFASESTPTESTPLPKKKRHLFRRIILYTTGLVGVFYAGSAVVAVNNDRYRDVFSESVPLGEDFIEYIEDRGWDAYLRTGLFSSAKESAQKTQKTISKSLGSASASASNALDRGLHAKDAVVGTVADAKEKTKSVVDRIVRTTEKKTPEVVDSGRAAVTAATGKAKASGKVIKERVHDASETIKEKVEEVGSDPRRAGIIFSDGVEELVLQVEAALAGKAIEGTGERNTQTVTSGSHQDATISREDRDKNEHKGNNVYPVDLPIGFEPPPGYTRPKSVPPSAVAQSSAAVETKPEPLPLVAPAVAELTSSEPILAQLASTIDQLASFLNNNPSATGKARGVLDTAKSDVMRLAEHIEAVKLEERDKLEAKLNEQVHEYTIKLLELEMEAQDKLDGQEQEFKEFFEQERRKFVQAYRQKLDNELRAQSEIINERLKEEVVAQGIEMQRRWIRDVKIRVEQERGGRLAKLDELAANLKRLERVALDNSAYLDENLRLHSLWSALRALNTAVDAPERRPFRDELRVLRHVAAARTDPVITSVLDALDSTDVPDIGIEPLPALSTWFSVGVLPQVTRVALVPEQDAGLLSHVASYLISTVRFQRHGLVEGDDVLSVLARAEHYMNEKDLDSATRELNQLNGTSKILLNDWLAAARQRLEVLQALEVIQAQATLASLLVV